MKFWIVTPSYNQLDWLKLCIASVADQATEGVKSEDLGVKQQNNLILNTENLNLGLCEPIRVHHHIQDACSTDGTREFLAEHLANSSKLKVNGYTFSYESAPDDGMYDAINRGWKRAADDVDVVAHLNCDEQYLPDALQTIASCFSQNQSADVILADMIVTDDVGEYICHRRALKPYAFISRFWCAGFTAASFYRLSVTKTKNVYFDISWKNIGDKVWFNALHQANCRFKVCNEIVSTFADTGDNLNWTEQGRQEGLRYMKEYLSFMHERMGLLKLLSRINSVRRFFKDMVCNSPDHYSVYLNASDGRVTKLVETPSVKWNKKAWN